MVLITEQFIEKILFDFTLNKNQCKILNLDFPLTQNWDTEILDKKVSEENIELLILLTGKLTEKAQEQIIKNYNFLQKYNNPNKEITAKNKEFSNIEDVSIYCDGACKNNPGPAGSGIAIYKNGQIILYSGLFINDGTNNIAELNALYQSLLFSENYANTVIYSDSTYAIDCITKWAINWEKNNWKKKGGEIKNLDLIQKSYYLYNKIKDSVIIKHVKAHSGIEGNELADRMAVLSIKERKKDFLEFKFDSVDEVLKMESY